MLIRRRKEVTTMVYDRPYSFLWLGIMEGNRERDDDRYYYYYY